MIRADQKSSGSSGGPIKAMIWTTISLSIATAIGRYLDPYLGIQQYLNLVGLGFLNIFHIVALFGSVMFLLIIAGILNSGKADPIGGYPRIGRRDRIERVRPVEEPVSFESVVLEAKSTLNQITRRREYLCEVPQ